MLRTSKLLTKIEVLAPLDKDRAQTTAEDFGNGFDVRDLILQYIKLPKLVDVRDEGKEDDDSTQRKTSVTTKTQIVGQITSRSSSLTAEAES